MVFYSNWVGRDKREKSEVTDFADFTSFDKIATIGKEVINNMTS